MDLKNFLNLFFFSNLDKIRAGAASRLCESIILHGNLNKFDFWLPLFATLNDNLPRAIFYGIISTRSTSMEIFVSLN